jgi:Family of unknown function (DUF5677)
MRTATAHNPDEIAADIEDLDNRGVTKLYLALRQEYRALVNRAERISRGSSGILSTGNRMFWGSVLFTRVVVTAKSVSLLLPDPKPGAHWDFSATASLTRNLTEACLVYHWLCGVGVGETEREGRFILYNLHDHGSRKRLLRDGEENPEVHTDLVRQFDANPYLATFDAKRRAKALKGETTPFIQDEVLGEIGFDKTLFRLIYRFFSQHTHTGPMAFYRIADNGHGTGVETRHEKLYMALVLGIAREFLVRAIEVQLDIVPDAETKIPHLTRERIKGNVERDQGRSRKRHR